MEDDLYAGATTQERFMMMMNERIGGIEEAVVKIGDAMSDMMYSFMDDVLVSSMVVATSMDIDATFVRRLAAAVQNTRRVAVSTAWASVHYGGGYTHTISVYLKLRAPVVASRVCEEMQRHVQAEFGREVSNIHKWTPSVPPGNEVVVLRVDF
jgi:hypothetical protein